MPDWLLHVDEHLALLRVRNVTVGDQEVAYYGQGQSSLTVAQERPNRSSTMI